MANYNSQYTGEQIDAAVGAVISGQTGGLSNEAKAALLACLNKVAWVDEDGQDYYNALYNALYPPANLVSISAVYTQSGSVYDTDSLDSLKSDLVVTGHFTDSSTQTITTYTLSGTLTQGTSTITVMYGGKTTTFTVVVSHIDNSIYNWDFTQSLIDSKQGAIAVLGENASRTSSGIEFTSAANSYAYLCDLSDYASTSYTMEVDVTNIVISPSQYNTCFINLSNSETGTREYGLEWDYYNLKWVMRWSGSNISADHDITSPTYFDGKTVKLQMDYVNSKAYLYVNGTLECTFTLTTSSSNNRNKINLGANSTARTMQTGSAITAVRIYSGLV